MTHLSDNIEVTSVFNNIPSLGRDYGLGYHRVHE